MQEPLVLMWLPSVVWQGLRELGCLGWCPLLEGLLLIFLLLLFPLCLAPPCPVKAPSMEQTEWGAGH